MAVDPATRRDFVALPDAHRVAALAGPKLVATRPAGCEPVAVAVDPATLRVYVADRRGDQVAVLQDHRLGPPTAGWAPAAHPGPARCVGVAASARGADGDARGR